MRASPYCYALITAPGNDSFRAAPYLCPAGVPTIGYGSTRYADGVRVLLSDAHITEPEAMNILITTLAQYVNAVNDYVHVPIHQCQFDALVDFAYNLGAGALKTSTLLTKLNQYDFQGAADEFPKWVHGGGVVLPGLVKRRAAEQDLFEQEM